MSLPGCLAGISNDLVVDVRRQLRIAKYIAKVYDKLGPGNMVLHVDRSATPDTSKVDVADWSVLARIDGKRSIDDITAALSMPARQVIGSLQKLRELGMLRIQSEQSPSRNAKESPWRRTATQQRSVVTARPKEASKPKPTSKKSSIRVPFPENWPISFEQFIFDPLELSQQVELKLEKRKQVIYYYYHLQRVSYYDLFQVDFAAQTRQIKRAYFKLSKEFHPDLFFRKELGAYKRKIEEIFRWLSGAYAVLSDNTKRQQYDQYIKRGFLGDWDSAATEAQNSGQAPETRSVPTGPSSRPVVGGDRRVQLESILRAAGQAERAGHHRKALQYYRAGMQGGAHGLIAHRAARCLLELNEELEEAEALCKKALAALRKPEERAEALLIQALIWERQRRLPDALQSLREASRLNAANPAVVQHLERLQKKLGATS